MTSLEILSRSHNGLYLGPATDYDLVEWLIWSQEWKVQESILTRECDLNQV